MMARQPPYPTGHFPNAAAFGKFMWGHGPEQAAKRLGTITLAELDAHGVTAAIAAGCRDFYAEAVLRGHGAETAPIRKSLMEKCVELLTPTERGTNG
jgi:hypothetical protein